MQTKSQSQTRPEPIHSKGTAYSEMAERTAMAERTIKLQKEYAKATKELNDLHNRSLKRHNKEIKIDLVAHVLLSVFMIGYLVSIAIFAYHSGFVFEAVIVSFGIVFYAVVHRYMYKKTNKA